MVTSSLTTLTDSQPSPSSKECSSVILWTDTLSASSISFATGWTRLFLTLLSDFTASKWQYFQFSSACSEAHWRFYLFPDVFNMSFTFRYTNELNLRGNVLLNIMFCISTHIVTMSRETCTSFRESTLFSGPNPTHGFGDPPSLSISVFVFPVLQFSSLKP